jgi:hypothetical protein
VWKTILVLIVIAAPLAAQEGFEPMFDGQTLKGWSGDPKLWSVEDGVVVGSTDGVKIKSNTFLITEREYGDFHLKFEVKLRNHNSGVQFRSEALPNWVVKGLQADMAQNNWWGSIYDEKGTRGVIVNGWEGKAEKVVRPGEWNDFEVYCKGELIQVRVNGLLTAELRDNARMTGVIALQLHRGPEMEARFRNVRIKTLD